jgi:hypothetical protein
MLITLVAMTRGSRTAATDVSRRLQGKLNGVRDKKGNPGGRPAQLTR